MEFARKSLNDPLYPVVSVDFTQEFFFFLSANIITRQGVFSFLSGEMKDVCN